MCLCNNVFVKVTACNLQLDGGFKYYIYILLLFGEDEPILTIIFLKGVETNHQLENIPPPKERKDTVDGGNPAPPGIYKPL